MDLSKFILIELYVFIAVKFLYCTQVYKSCRQALKNNSDSGNYQIQPINSGTIADVFCSLVGDHVLTRINSNHGTFRRFDSPSQLVLQIKYENLNKQELQQFLRYAGLCSQQMKLYVDGSHSSHLFFQFLDGSLLRLFPINDGICNCLITQP